MKPFWGACTWEFQDSGIEVPTGITDIVVSKDESAKCIYDLSGRKVNNPEKGIYIINGKKQVVK